MSTSKAEGPAWIDEVLDRHESALLRYAQRLLGDPEAAKDVVQETFLRLCQAEEATVGPRLPEWLYVVCRNRALDLRRSQQRRHKVRRDRPEVLRGEALPVRSPVEELERRQTLSQVERLVEALPERQADLLRLRFRDGLSYREIALKRGLTVSNVGYLLHMSMRSLREQLQGGLDGTG